MARRISNVNMAVLTAEEKRENADALARTAQLTRMYREAKKLPGADLLQKRLEE